MNKISIIIISLFLLISCGKQDSSIKKRIGKISDSILITKNKNGEVLKTIYYPSKKKDSFKLRANYVNNKLQDSFYMTDSGLLNGKMYNFENDSIIWTYEYLIVNNESYLNQSWSVSKLGDTLSFGNNYDIILLDTIRKNSKKYFNIELVLDKSYKQKISHSFFVKPKLKSSKLNEDFSNINTIEMDTIQSLSSDDIKGNESYGTYWSKRVIKLNVEFDDNELNILRGLLVERSENFKIKNEEGVDEKGHFEREIYVNTDLQTLPVFKKRTKKQN